MFYSKKFKLLYIACPKTGSTSVEKLLFDLDPEGEKFSITISGKKMTGKDMNGRAGHARARDIRKAIGESEYEKLTVFGFVRHPLEKLVSSYFFNKKGKIYEPFVHKGKIKFDSKRAGTFLSKLMPRILPFSVWQNLYPMKTGYEYYFDDKGNKLVDFIGRTEYLEIDLKNILKEIGINSDIDVPHVNKSTHDSAESYFKNTSVKQKILDRYKDDVELYIQAERDMINLQRRNSINYNS